MESDAESDGGGADDLMRPAFPVSDVPDFDPTAVPTSGEEFLRLVRYEAKRCPDIMVAKNIDPRAFDSRQTVRVADANTLPVTPESRRPSPEWHHQTVSTFVDIRQFLRRTQLRRSPAAAPRVTTRLPKASDKPAWRALSLGKPGEGDVCEGDAEDTALPSISAMGRLDQATVAKVLEYHSEWSKECPFTIKQGVWVYALLCCLDTVMTSDVTATLRELCRSLIDQRAKLAKEDRSPAPASIAIIQPQEDDDSQRLAGLNIIIVLIGDFFRQRDLLEI